MRIHSALADAARNFLDICLALTWGVLSGLLPPTAGAATVHGRALQSFTFQLNSSTFEWGQGNTPPLQAQRKAGTDNSVLTSIMANGQKGKELPILRDNTGSNLTDVALCSMLSWKRQPLCAVLVHGHDVGTCRAAVQALTGICPQHDTLWDELTASEHLAGGVLRTSGGRGESLVPPYTRGCVPQQSLK
jgi:hypothetical protein